MTEKKNPLCEGGHTAKVLFLIFYLSGLFLYLFVLATHSSWHICELPCLHLYQTGKVVQACLSVFCKIKMQKVANLKCR